MRGAREVKAKKSTLSLLTLMNIFGFSVNPRFVFFRPSFCFWGAQDFGPGSGSGCAVSGLFLLADSLMAIRRTAGLKKYAGEDDDGKNSHYQPVFYPVVKAPVALFKALPGLTQGIHMLKDTVKRAGPVPLRVG